MLEKFIAMQNKRRKKGGFTLVELIVVLVILAILAALLIPALTGYIDKAKKKSIIAETRQVVMAAQTIADEKYAKAAANTADTAVTFESDADKKEVKTLAEVEGDIDSITCAKGQITKVIYKHNGKTCTYNRDATDDKYTSD